MLVNGTLRPTIVALWSSGDKEKLQSILRTASTGSVALTLIPLAILAFFGSWIMGLFFGDFYRDGGTVLFIISLGWFSLLMFGPAGTLMMLVGKQRQYFYCAMASGLVFLAAALTLPTYFAVQGVALAVALGTFVNSALATIYAWRVMGVKTFCYLSTKGAAS
jgi:O-antigen/teichoic acid export membrane protein